MKGNVKKLSTWLIVMLMVFGSCVTSVSGAVGYKYIDGNDKDNGISTTTTDYEFWKEENLTNTTRNGITVTYRETTDDDGRSEIRYVSWSADSAVQVKYVWVKASDGGHLFSYTNETHDEDLFGPLTEKGWPHKISHVTFYYEEEEEVDPVTLIVRKVLVPSDEITDVSGDTTPFKINILSNNTVVEDCDLENGEQASFQLAPGVYKIEEVGVQAPYSLKSVSLNGNPTQDNEFTLSEEGATITVYNEKAVVPNEETGNITIRKIVQELTEAGGWVSVDDDNTFLVNVSRTPAGEPINDNPIEIAVGQNGSIGDLDYGTYYITEVTPTSRYTIYDGEEDEYYDTVTLSSENQSATATIVNRIIPTLEETGTVTFIKELVDENGDAIVTREPSFKIKLTDSDNQSQVYNVPAGTPYTTAVLPIGSYKAEEIEIPNGYEFVSISHELFNLTKDGFTIRVKNKKLDDTPPPTPKGTIIVKKVILDKNENINEKETREFVIRVKKNDETNNYVDFTLKNGELEKRGQFGLGEYVISELDLPADYDVFFSLSSDTDEDGKVDLNKDGDAVTVTVTNIQKATPSIPTISKDDGGVRVYPGDTITYEIEVDPKDYSLNNGFLIETPDSNTEYIGGNEWAYMGIGEDGKKIYRYNLYASIPMFARSEYSPIPEIPEFKVKVKESTLSTVELVTNFVSLYYNSEGSEHITTHEDTPILYKNDDDDDNDDNDDDDDNDDNPPTIGKPDLFITKTDNGAMVSPGALVEYVITVENKGNANAEGVKVYETLPVGTEFVAAGNDGWVLEDGKYVYSLGMMNIDDKKEVKFVLKVSDPLPVGIDKILNIVEVKDDGIETATTDNRASDDTPILIAKLLIGEPPVIVPSTPPAVPAPELPMEVTIISEPTPHAVPDLPFTGGVVVEIIVMGLGLSLAAGGIVLKRK
ncbi:MAG: hypothetical protein K0R31_1798 [Clostridiales bacterium]|nr:hypothetical protein [Clostridiales bacterium]